MSEDEIDRQWKPNNRPQSTMARSFSLALNDLFDLDNKLAEKQDAVFEKKKAVSSQTSELEALEARLKATEERLAAAGLSTIPSGRSSPKPRTPLGDTFAQSGNPTKDNNSATSPLSTEYTKGASRPGTANRPKTGEGRGQAWRGQDMPPLPGQLPPTPGASEDGDAPPPPTRQD